MALHQPARPAARALRLAGLGIALLLSASLAACGAPSASPSGIVPSPPGSSSRVPSSWARGTIQQPEAVTGRPSSTPTYCAPCHPSVITEMRDVAATDAGFVAVGAATPNLALVWSSTDGRSWTIGDGVPQAAGSRLNAVAVGDGGSVIVGRGSKGAAAWVLRDGRWVTASVPATEGAMTSVIATTDGYLAAGYRGPEFGTARAAFWRSPDGASWASVPDAPALADGRVAALAATDQGFVAVGASGSPGSEQVGAVSWTSPDGAAWTRAPGQPSLDEATMLSVAATKGTLVAVGTVASGDRAVAWTSPDGLAWTRAPDAAAFASNSTYAPHAQMSDVLSAPHGLLAVGWNSSASNGSAVIWTSPDGVTWTREPDEPSLSGGGMSGVALRDGVVVAVGSTGWPDTHAATAWRHDR